MPTTATKPVTRPRVAAAAEAAKLAVRLRKGVAPAELAFDSAAATALVAELETLREAAKALYAQADAIEAKLIQGVGVGKAMPLADGRTVRINDNFIDGKTGEPKQKAFKVCGISRYEVAVK